MPPSRRRARSCTRGRRAAPARRTARSRCAAKGRRPRAVAADAPDRSRLAGRKRRATRFLRAPRSPRLRAAPRKGSRDGARVRRKAWLARDYQKKGARIAGPRELTMQPRSVAPQVRIEESERENRDRQLADENHLLSRRHFLEGNRLDSRRRAPLLGIAHRHSFELWKRTVGRRPGASPAAG